MLELTDRAAEAVRLIVSSADVPQTGGLRIYARPIDEESASIDLALVGSPSPEDAVIGEEDAKVFVEPGAGMLLDDKVLDATVEGEQVAFSVADQQAAGPSEDGSAPS